ncbi:hypothetical protein BH10ACT10_BH10ACT10_07950 [soil metagenome]
MPHGDRDISLEEIRATADLIDRTVRQLLEAQNGSDGPSAELMKGAWQTPGASTTFQNKWTEWNSAMNKMLQVGPEFSQWLRNYARDAHGLDEAYRT